MKKSEKELRGFLVAWRIKYGDKCPNLYHNSWLEEIVSMCVDCWATYAAFSKWANSVKASGYPPPCGGINNGLSADGIIIKLKEFLETDTHSDKIKVFAIKDVLGVKPRPSAGEEKKGETK